MARFSDWARIGAILFASIFGLIYFLNALVPDFFIGMSGLFFIALMALGIWAFFKIFQLEKTQKLDLGMLLLFTGIIALIIIILIKYPQISPPLSVVAQSLIGVG